MNETKQRPVLVFNATAFDAAVEQLGYETKAAKADFLGVSQASYSKVSRGLEQPSSKFIAAVLLKFSDPDNLNRFFRAEVR